MLSRRALFSLGLSRLVEELDSAPAPPPVPACVAAPAPRPAWPRGDGAYLWAAASEALPRLAGQRVLEVDELDLDLASVPFEDAEFDGIVSAFGPMFSSDGRAAIDELFRVVRPGGTVGFTAWTPLGVVGRLLRLAGTHDPLPPGVPPPLAWGREERLRQELDRHSDAFELRPLELTLRFGSREEAVERLFGALGPLAVAPRQPELRERARAIVDALAGDEPGPVALRAPYLMAVAERRALPY